MTTKAYTYAFAGQHSAGITVLDYFAAAALTGMLHNYKTSADDDLYDMEKLEKLMEGIASDAYTVAEHMIESRKCYNHEAIL
jgi:hypothetical protein